MWWQSQSEQPKMAEQSGVGSQFSPHLIVSQKQCKVDKTSQRYSTEDPFLLVAMYDTMNKFREKEQFYERPYQSAGLVQQSRVSRNLLLSSHATATCQHPKPRTIHNNQKNNNEEVQTFEEIFF